MSESHHVFGVHAVRAALRTGGVTALWLEKNRRDPRVLQLERAARERNIPIHRVDRRTLDELAEGGQHQGVVAAHQAHRTYGERELEDRLTQLTGGALFLVLDGVQDPHNLGACLRTADAAGVDGVITPRDRACGLTPTVTKVAAGAAASVPLYQVTNLVRVLKTLQHAGIRVVGTAGETETELFATDLTGPVALVLGAEEKGLRRLTRETCDALVRIPMRGTVESLNVSVAAGICLFEGVRQRLALARQEA